MELEIEKRYCQSCGMPLDINQEELLGTNGDQTKCDEYCVYCYQNGQYTVDYSVGQTINMNFCFVYKTKIDYLCIVTRMKTGRYGQKYFENGYRRQSSGSPQI